MTEPDYTQMSNEELQAIVDGRTPSIAASPAPSGQIDYASMSDEQLRAIVERGKPPRTWSDTATALGQSFVRGASSLAAMSPFSPPQNSPGAAINEMSRQQLVGDPKWDGATKGERYLGAALEAAPFAVLGGGVINTMAGGVGGEVAKDAGYNPLIGSILGSLGSQGLLGGIKSISTPFTKEGEKQLAGKVLKEAAGDNGMARLSGYLDDVPYGRKTFAEVADTPSAAKLQTAMRQEPGVGDQLDDLFLQRQLNRKSALSDISPATLDDLTVTPDIRGERIRAETLPVFEREREIIDDAWTDLGKKNQTFVAQDKLREIAKEGQAFNPYKTLSSEARRVLGGIDDLLQVEATGGGAAKMSIKDYHHLRSAAGEALAKAANFGNDEEARLMAVVREKLDTAAYEAAKRGGVTGEKLDKLGELIDESRNFISTFKTGVPGQIVRKGEGGFAMRASAIPGKIVATPEAAQSYMKAYGAKPEAVKEAKAALLDPIIGKKYDSWPTYFEKNKAQFKAIFGDDYDVVKSVFDDIKSETNIFANVQKASGRQSITGQAITTAKWLLDATGHIRNLAKGGAGVGGTLGALLNGPWGATVGASMGFVLQTLAARSEQEIKNLIVSGLKDPAVAYALAAKAGPGALEVLGRTLIQGGAVGAAKEFGSASYPSGDNERKPSTTRSPTPQKLLQPSEGIEIGRANPSPHPTPDLPATQGGSGSGGGGGGGGSVNLLGLLAKQPPLIRAMIDQESGRDPRAVSKKGAMGLLQLMPETAKAWGVRDPFDPEENIRGGIAAIRDELTRFGDPALALAAYNAGSPAVLKAISKAKSSVWEDVAKYLPAETRDYVPAVFERLQAYE